MRVRGLPLLSLAAMFTLASSGVFAQDSTSGRRGTPSAGGSATATPGAGLVAVATKYDAPLADAVQRRDKQAVQALLKKKADVNAPQSDGATALHWAAYLEDAETTALLIRAGANVNATNNYGVTPLILAATNGNAAVINQLLKAGVDPNTTVRAGETRADARGAQRKSRSGESAFDRRRQDQRRRKRGTDNRR